MRLDDAGPARFDRGLGFREPFRRGDVPGVVLEVVGLGDVYNGLDEEGEFHDEDCAEYGDPAPWKYPGDSEGNRID